jgi:hypothetical protein
VALLERRHGSTPPPAQNARAGEDQHTRFAFRGDAPSSAATSCSRMSSANALSLSGRFSVSVATASSNFVADELGHGATPGLEGGGVAGGETAGRELPATRVHCKTLTSRENRMRAGSPARDRAECW